MTRRGAAPAGQSRSWTHSAVRALVDRHGENDPVALVRTISREFVSWAVSCGWDGPPFDPFTLASLRGIKLRSGTSDMDVSAFIHPLDPETLEIVWHPDLPASRRAFSICHEIAHTFFPDAFELVHFRHTARDRFDPDRELEELCDVAAAELLMPLEPFVADLQSLGVSLDGQDALRARYGASREAVALRAMDLTADACAVAIVSERLKPTEERHGGRAASPKARIDLMAVSRSFTGPRLPRHKSVPEWSVVSKVLRNPELQSGASETWSTGEFDLPPCRIDVRTVPPGAGGVPRVIALFFED